MNMKNLVLFFLALASLLLVGNMLSAATEDLASITDVKVNGLYSCYNSDLSVIAGETVPVEVYFTSLVNASDVRIKVEIEGEKIDVTDRIGPFDVEEGKRYLKTLHIKIPYELRDEVSDNLALEVKIWNNDYKTEYPEITLRVQRPSYNVDILSVESDDEVEAGDNFFVIAVLKNIGYDDLDNLFVKVKIPALGIEKSAYVGDLVAVEDDGCCSDDEDDTVQTQFALKIPYDAAPGIYNLEVEVENDDVVINKQKQISIKNDLASGNLLVATSKKSFSVDEEGKFDLLVVNPTDKLRVYKVVVSSPSELYVEGDSLVAVPAGSTTKLKLSVSASKTGDYDFSVSLLSGDEIVSTQSLQASVTEENESGKNQSTTSTDPMLILTIVLAVVFIVLLVILIVLLGKKPEKQQEEFGESYY